MASFSRKENVLLGFNQPISAPQSPDIDFHDVFGGPPRRASIQETRNIFGETRNSFDLRNEDETISHRRHRWSGLSEKPVFGEEGVNRRRYASNDFFDDIFRGNDSPRDPVHLNSPSKVLSPGRPISPRVSEPYPSSSLPALLSLPGKLINYHKNKDGISNGLFAHSPLSRFSTQVQEEPRNSVSSKSSLSQEISRNSDELASLEQSEEVKKDSNLKKDSTDSQVPNVGPQFHFSIYRWASKGAPLPLSFRAGYKSKIKERFKLDRSVSASGRIACEGMTKESPTGTSNKTDNEIEFDNTKNSSNVNVLQSKPVEDANLTGNSIFQDLKAEKGQISAAIQEAPKSNTKTLRSILLGNDEAKKAEKSEVKSMKKSSAGEKVSKRDEERITPNKVEMEKANAQGTPISSQDIPSKNRAKGKIKEFVKMFDQGTSDQSKIRDNSFSRSFRWMERGKNRTQDEQNRPTPVIDEDRPRTSTAAATEKVDVLPKKPEKDGSQVRTNDYKAADISSESKDSSISAAATIPDGSEARDEHVADSCHENIQIKYLTQDENELQQAGNSHEEIQAIDDRIRKWSQGKQGNIRSLLSTLQYVLWSESGWKPVPLVNIIEGNAVKRSYQKALLSLHPDKLQQKGATSDQKYIAEKVFDILQEAWTHFNLLGSV